MKGKGYPIIAGWGVESLTLASTNIQASYLSFSDTILWGVGMPHYSLGRVEGLALITLDGMGGSVAKDFSGRFGWCGVVIV